DMVIIPIGGGGLVSGIGNYFKEAKPEITIVGVEPEGAPSMKAALAHGGPVTLDQINRFVDGAAVKRIGDLTYRYGHDLLEGAQAIPEGKICTTILEPYNKDGIVAEPAGALAVAALDSCADHSKGKKVVCIVSG